VIDPQTVVAMRRLRRALTLWRIVAVALAVAAGVALWSRFADTAGGAYVARVAVEGFIFDDARRDDVLTAIAQDPKAKALVVRIDSPGGSFVGGHRLFRELSDVAESKPVVAVMGGLATSAAYMTALGADRIFANPGTVTGSIGVIVQSADMTGLLEKLGIKPETVKSAPLKAQPNPLEPFDDAARAATAAVVEDLYQAFVDMVADNRPLERERVVALADGRVYVGLRALDLDLIDALGDEGDARAWLDTAHGVSADLPVRDVSWDDDSFLDRAVFDAARSIIGKPVFSERLNLDGVLSVWHPSFK
jgi:protease-4